MIDTAALLKKTKNGFGNLEVSEKYINSALKWLEVWLTDPMFEDYVPQIRYLVESEKWDILLNTFYQVIPFGMVGRRRLVGVGPKRFKNFTAKPSDHWDSNGLITQCCKNAAKCILKAHKVKRYHKWPYLIFIIAWGISFLILLIFAGLAIFGLQVDATLPNLFGMFFGGLTMILGKFFIEDLKADNIIWRMFVTQYLNLKNDRSQKKHGIEEK